MIRDTRLPGAIQSHLSAMLESLRNIEERHRRFVDQAIMGFAVQGIFPDTVRRHMKNICKSTLTTFSGLTDCVLANANDAFLTKTGDSADNVFGARGAQQANLAGPQHFDRTMSYLSRTGFSE